MESIFENHSLYNKYLVMDGMRASSGNTPSLYITEVKLKKALQSLSDIEIENIFEREMPPYGIKIKRQSVQKKITTLQDWQLLKALEILMTTGAYDAILFVVKSKRTDKEPN